VAEASPFAVLSLIVAPAILTNASTVLAMSTSNRLARAVDRARELSRQLETDTASDDQGARRLYDLTVTEDRTVLLMRALRSFYTALGAFSTATLLSLIGAVATRALDDSQILPLELLALVVGTVAVSAIVHGSILLLRETGMAVTVLQNRAERVREQSRARRTM
jgi:hypothetical protein